MTLFVDEMSILELLEEIILKNGAYSQDHLTHAGNCIENASRCAKKIKEKIQGIITNYADSTDKWERDISEFLKDIISEAGNK